MATDKKTSNLVENQFPQFVLDEGPNLVAFVKAYYAWAEQANNVIEVSKNLRNYQDIDNTTDQYLEYFHREIMNSIPRSTLADKRKLAKHIKDLYRSRGSELSYRLLFRLLYNEEIEFYYPGEDILRASDGRWVKDSSIRVAQPRAGIIADFIGEEIYGETSGATARVDNIVNTISGGLIVDEMYLLDINGTFEDGEKVYIVGDNSVYATIFGVSGPLQSVTITKGGAYHRADDLVNFTSTSGAGASGRITGTTDTSAVEWSIADGGSGYTTGATITVSGGSGSNAEFEITAISNTEVIPINSNIIEDVANCVLNTGPYFVSAGANTAAVGTNFATANVSSQLSTALDFNNLTVGTISSITTTNYGYGYSTLPSSTVVEQDVADLLLSDGSGGYKGLNASIVASNASGAITSVNVSAFGADYSRYEPVTITNTTRAGTQAAEGNPSVSGVVNYPGRYIDTKGWLSWNNRLQDNYYYQEFSYEIKSDQLVNTYRSLVQDILHPAGMKMFGRIRLYLDLEPPVVTVDSTSYNRLNITQEIVIDIPSVVASDENTYVSSVANTDMLPTPELVATMATTTVESNVWLYTPGTGTLFIANTATINAYASNTINTYASVPISYLGSPQLLIGNNTVFTVEVPTSNTPLLIIDNYGGTSNGVYFTDTTYSNVALSITTDYAGVTLSNGAFYIAANTSA